MIGKMTKTSDFHDFKTIDDALAVYGHGCGEMSSLAKKMVDERGLRPGDPSHLRKVANSAFSLADLDKDGVPVFKTSDYTLDEEVRDPVPFGFLEDRDSYAEFDLVPWMGIAPRPGQIGMAEEIDMMDFFREDDDEPTDVLTVICETNKTHLYEPVSMISSRSFKEVNDAAREYERKFQACATKKNVLVLGSGSSTLCNTFDLTSSTVVYVDESNLNLKELERRFQEMHIRPKVHKCVQGDAVDVMKKLKKNSFGLIVANNSIHHICSGNVDKHRDVLNMIHDLLTANGAFIGFGPSLSGLSATPYTNDSRNRHGLYGIVDPDSPKTVSNLGGVHFKENVFFSTLLYELEKKGGRAEVCHLSTFVHGQVDNTLVRCYETFSFMKGGTRPEGVRVEVSVDATCEANPLIWFGINVHGKEPVPVVLTNLVQEQGSLTAHRTYGSVLRSQHTPVLLYQGPYVVSTKLDGDLGELECREGKWTLKTEEFRCDLDLPGVMDDRGEPVDCHVMVEVFRGFGSVTMYWLETLYFFGKPYSWLGGLRRNLPIELGFKEYRSMNVMNTVKSLCDKSVPGDGIVFLNPHDRAGGMTPKHIFYKPSLSVDVQINGAVYEMFRAGSNLRSGHEPNGSLRVFESPFYLNSRVLMCLLTQRFDKMVGTLGEQDFLSLDDVLSYPAMCGTSMKTKLRNTALVQLWRGRWSMGDSNDMINLIAPLGRHADWGLFGVLADTILSGAPDKDHIVYPENTAIYDADGDAEDAIWEDVGVEDSYMI